MAFAGTPEVAVPTLMALQDSGHDVVAVLSKPDAPAGRGRKLTPSAVSSVAHDLELPLYTPPTLEGISSTLAAHAVDVVAVVAYGLLVPTEALSATRLGWINAHFSLLPAWRGAAPVQRCIAAGDSVTGVTTFRIDQGLDTGPILLQSGAITVEARDDSGALLARLAPVGAELMVRTLDALAEGTIEPHPQSNDGVSLAPQLTTDDARVNWHGPVHHVDRWIRACTPAPGAWTTVRGERLLVGTPRGVEVDNSAVPGRFVVDRQHVRVGAQGGYVVLGEVRPHGRKSMPAAAWVRGLREELPDAQ